MPERFKDKITGQLEKIPFIGSLPYKILGLRKETNRVRWLPTLISQTAFRLYCETPFHKVDFIGELPEDGLALGVSNHKQAADTLKGGNSGRKLARRQWYTLARKGMLDPDYEEPERFREGNEHDFLYSAPRWVKRFGAYVLLGIGCMPVTRGDLPFEAIRNFKAAAKDKLLIGMFLQEKRQKDGTLKGIKDGIGFFVLSTPDIPIYPMAMYRSEEGKDTMRIGRRLTLDEILYHPAFRTDLEQKAAITLFIADEIAYMLPFEQRKDWFGKTRKEYIEYSLKKATEAASRTSKKST